MYKESIYNIKLIASDNRMLIYNTRSGAFVAIENEMPEFVEEMLDAPNEFPPDEKLLLDLIEGGFIVHNAIDEFSEVLGSFQKGIESNDLVITILPAETCNFRCPYCYEKLRDQVMPPSVQEDIIAFVGHLSKDIKSLHIAWYGGEPTLAKRTVIRLMSELAIIAQERNIAFDGRMTTNGFLLTSQNFESFIQHGIRFFQVTIDGPKDEHDRLRVLHNGRGTFDRIWNNLREIKKIDGDFLFRIRANFHRENIQSMYRFIDLFTDDFGDDHRFLLAFRSIWKGEFQENDLPICSIMEGMYIQNELVHYAFSKLGRMENIQVINPLPRPIRTWCPAQNKHYLIIGADGLLWKCDLAANHEDMSIGQLVSEGIAELDDKKVARWVDPNIYSSDSKCIHCKFLPICQGGCAFNRLRRNPICIYEDKLIHEAMESRYKIACT